MISWAVRIHIIACVGMRQEHSRTWWVKTHLKRRTTHVAVHRLVVSSAKMSNQPKGELVIQTIAMPQDTNPNGDIFGGWVTSQMDLGSGILAAKTAQARVVTAAMEGMSFLQPVRVGDTVRCYAHVEKIGRTSMTIPVEVWVTRYMTGEELKVTHGVFTLVAVDESGKPIPVKRGSA